MKRIIILGSTGSIGTQTADVVRDNNRRAKERGEGEPFKIMGLAANKNSDMVEKQVREFGVKYVAMYDEGAANDLRKRLKDTDAVVYSGMDGLNELAGKDDYDVLVTAIVGMIGIRPTITAIKNKKDIALANKETLVTAGHIIMPLAKENNVKILPVDSEHSAIFQSLQGNPEGRIKRILLTASGGPFRGYTKEQLKDVTVERALKHPNWTMGRKITIDSATMVNKGLEVMEARWLFNVGYDDITVVVHPQSILHSAVEYVDGAVIGQMGMPDMKIPISLALSYPDRMKLLADFADGYGCDDPLSRSSDGSLDLFTTGARLTFEKPDRKVFRCIDLAYEALKEGGAAPVVMNGANEELVAMFLAGKIGFLDIPQTIEKVMEKSSFPAPKSVEEILETDRRSRKLAKEMLD